MFKQNQKILFIIIAVLVLGALGYYLYWYFATPGQYDDFARCLKDKGAIFYGAFWCPHCQNQKTMFGKSARLLPYVECSAPDGKSQYQVCIDKKINNYPTWIFNDESRLVGEIPLSVLAEKTGCVLGH
ncbi:MAG: hypothetical protein AAB527_02325 [Patescibacteria group bacterium]